MPTLRSTKRRQRAVTRKSPSPPCRSSVKDPAILQQRESRPRKSPGPPSFPGTRMGKHRFLQQGRTLEQARKPPPSPPRRVRQLTHCPARGHQEPGYLAGCSHRMPRPARDPARLTPGCLATASQAREGPPPGHLIPPDPGTQPPHRQTGHLPQPATTHLPERVSHWLLPQRQARRRAPEEEEHSGRQRCMLGSVVHGPASAEAASPVPLAPSGPDAPARATPAAGPDGRRPLNREPRQGQRRAPWPGRSSAAGKTLQPRESPARKPRPPRRRLPGRPSDGARARWTLRLSPG